MEVLTTFSDSSSLNKGGSLECCIYAFDAELLQLEDVDDDQKKDKFLSEHGDRLIEQGFSNPYRMSLENKDSMIHMMRKHHLYYR